MRVAITRDKYDAVLFDLDGVITDTASMHAACWKQMFEAYLQKRAVERGEPFHPFELATDYRLYVAYELEFDVIGTYEGELESWTGSGGVTVPLGEQFSMRIAAQTESLGGWVDNAATGRESGETERDSGRITVAWEPSDRFDATLVYEAQEYEGRGMPAEAILATAEAFGLSALAGFPEFETNFDRVSASSDSRVNDAFFEDSSVDRASLTAHWHIGEFVFTSQTAWSQSDSDATAGTDFLPGDYLLQVVDLEADAFSQEFRLTSPGEERFRYVAGAYYGSNEFEQSNCSLRITRERRRSRATP
jgi:hypothetical protein